jgi:Ca2+-binding EF-hand superfamily protein
MEPTNPKSRGAWRPLLIPVLAAALIAGIAGCTDAAEEHFSHGHASIAGGAIPGPHGDERFAQASLDGDGALSASELEAAPGPGPMLAAHLDELDADGDGALTHDEIAAAMKQHHGAGMAPCGHGDEAFAQADLDHDGTLSASELEAAPAPAWMLAAHLDEIDGDGDGALSHAEIAAAMNLHHGDAPPCDEDR